MVPISAILLLIGHPLCTRIDYSVGGDRDYNYHNRIPQRFIILLRIFYFNSISRMGVHLAVCNLFNSSGGIYLLEGPRNVGAYSDSRDHKLSMFLYLFQHKTLKVIFNLLSNSFYRRQANSSTAIVILDLYSILNLYI